METCYQFTVICVFFILFGVGGGVQWKLVSRIITLSCSVVCYTIWLKLFSLALLPIVECTKCAGFAISKIRHKTSCSRDYIYFYGFLN